MELEMYHVVKGGVWQSRHVVCLLAILHITTKGPQRSFYLFFGFLWKSTLEL
jgi:hypothetical protein